MSGARNHRKSAIYGNIFEKIEEGTNKQFDRIFRLIQRFSVSVFILLKNMMQYYITANTCVCNTKQTHYPILKYDDPEIKTQPM